MSETQQKQFSDNQAEIALGEVIEKLLREGLPPDKAEALPPEHRKIVEKYRRLFLERTQQKQ